MTTLMDYRPLQFKPVSEIILTIEVDEDGYLIVSDPHLAVYGAGHNLEEAVSDFASMLQDLFIELETTEALSDHLHAQLAYLRTILQPLHHVHS